MVPNALPTDPTDFTPSNPHRKIFPAGSDSSLTNTVHVAFAPSLGLSLSAGTEGEAASSSALLNQSASPIVLTAPDPFGRPDLGDGSNQCVYDVTTPKGNLIVPGVIGVPSAGADDTSWLLTGDLHYLLGNAADVTLDLPGESALHDCYEQASAGQVAYVYGSSNKAGMQFQGLPTNNSGFGNHLATLTVEGHNSQYAHIQTFFAAKASNYPTAATDTSTNTFPTPNWYQYYSQVYAATGKYEPGDRTYTDFSASPYTIHIEDQTYGTIGGVHVYALKPGANTISWAGDIQLSGIWLYISVCAHEKEHQDACTDGTYAVDTTNPNKPLMLTSDNDRLDNTWEDNHYFDSTLSNTTLAPAYGNETDAPDDEAIADIVGLGKLLDALDDWKQDWAGVPSGGSYEGGLQFGTSHLATKPGGTYPTPYFQFTPVTQNPDQSFTLGTPIKIWSKDDLKAAVPGLMTSLLEKPARPQ